MDPWFIKDSNLTTKLNDEDLEGVHAVCPRAYRAGDEAELLYILLGGQG